MDNINYIKNIWETLLNIEDIKLNRDSDYDIQGLTILLQVFSANVKRLVNRCVLAEKSLSVATNECSVLEFRCSELNNALISEKAKECSQCPKLRSQIESLRKALAEKKSKCTQPCAQCQKLWLKIKSQKKKLQESGEKMELLQKILGPNNGSNKNDKYNTALNYVSQMMLLAENDDADSFDARCIFPQTVTKDTPKRKSPSFDKDLDTKNPKRSPCVDLDPHETHFEPVPQASPKNEPKNEESKMMNRLSDSKFIEKKTETKTEGNTECRDGKKFNIIVPETLADEYVDSVDVQRNIIIPETLAQDDFATLLPDVCSTPEKQIIDRSEKMSPILTSSTSKKLEKSSTPLSNLNLEDSKNEVGGMRIVKREYVSASKISSDKQSPSILALETDNNSQSKDLKVLDKFFDEIGKSTANAMRRSKKVAKDILKSTDGKTCNSEDKFVAPIKKNAALGEKNVWLLKKANALDHEKIDEVACCQKKMKQTTLAVVSMAKNQDISNNDSFNGGVLSEPPDEEDFDSDGSECLVLPSPKNIPDVSLSLSGIRSIKPKTDKENTGSTVADRKTCISSLDETYFAPQISSTCLSLSRRNRNENEGKDEHTTIRGRTKKEDLETSYDVVPNRVADSPKYRYKDDPVRKKHERQQLPGWDCNGCAKYYDVARRDGEDPQEHRDKCSRHRSKYKDLNKTVKGFWDPCIPDTDASE